MRNGGESSVGADALVVGGGVIGLSIARALGQRGLRVTVLERGVRSGAEASWAAAGMLAPQAEAHRADNFFHFQCAGRDFYPAFAATLFEETGIDIELDCTGTLYLAFDEADEAELRARAAWQRRAGLNVEELTGDEARTLEPRLSSRARFALRFPLDWQVENRQMVAALEKSCAVYGVHMRTGVEVKSVRVGTGGRVAGVETADGFIHASAVVIAAGAWSSHLKLERARESVLEGEDVGEVPHIEPVRGQMLCFSAPPQMAFNAPWLRHVVYTARGYLVPRRDGRVLVGATTERVGFTQQVTSAGLQALATCAAEIAPSLLSQRGGRTTSWAGLRPCTADELPVIGACADAPGLFYATGHYRNGILLAPITGALVADMIADGATPDLLEPFTPDRFGLACLS